MAKNNPRSERIAHLPRFALDVGGVLASMQHDGEPQEGSREFLYAHLDMFEFWVLSQCGTTRKHDTIKWLKEHDFPIPHSRQLYVNFSELKWPDINSFNMRYFIDDPPRHVVPAERSCPYVKAFFLFGYHLKSGFAQRIHITKDWAAVTKFFEKERNRVQHPAK